MAYYSVNVREYILKDLMDKGAVEMIADTFFVLNNLKYYDLQIGLDAVNNDCFNYIVLRR